MGDREIHSKRSAIITVGHSERAYKGVSLLQWKTGREIIKECHNYSVGQGETL